MAESKKVKRPRKRFLDVDPFRAKFGPISEKAIYDVFQTIFKVEDHNMKKHSFPHCVKALRKYKLQQMEK